MTKRNLIIAIPIVAVVLNGLGYLIFSKARVSPPSNSADTTGGRPAATGTTPAAQGTATRAPAGGAAHADDPAERETRAQARREAGLAALEAGEYDKALINFTEAKSLVGDKANVGDLLKVTEELRRKPPLAAGDAKARPAAPGAEPLRKAAARSSQRRVAVREEAVEEPAPPPAVQASGLLIVTTTPRGMLVHVDDSPIDLTPMKTKVKPGTHRVTLLDGDRKVYETTVDIRDGGTATILRDLSGERAPEAPRPIAAAPVSPPPMKAEAPRTAPVAPAAPVPAESASESAFNKQPQTAALTGAAGNVGVLDISSPGLYGVVWVNGRPRGYPPLAVRDLPPGPAKVEVRVNGVQKRTATAIVRAGLTTSVKLRSLESAP